jgi:hypothetical protein
LVAAFFRRCAEFESRLDNARARLDDHATRLNATSVKKPQSP